MPCLTTRCLVHLGLLLVQTLSAGAYITYLEVRIPLRGKQAPRGSVWPEPQLVQPSQIQRFLEPASFRITTNDLGSRGCDVLVKGAARYAKLLFFNAMTTDGGEYDISSLGRQLARLDVNVSLLEEQYCRYPRFGDDESYNLTVPEDGDAFLNATTVWGALRGLETFSQLFYQHPQSKRFLVNVTSVLDHPRFLYRGLLVDCTTRFLPVKTLKRNLDAMAYNKFNVFHWLLGDATAWRLKMAAFPNLTTVARLPRHMYRPRDVQDIIEHARLRGIRVIPEIAIARPPKLLLEALPVLMTVCQNFAEQRPEALPDCPSESVWNVIDLSHGPTREVYTTIFKEVAELFKDEYMHLGSTLYGKTVPTKVTETRKEIIAKLQLYMNEVINFTRDQGFKPMVWHDIMDAGITVPRDVVVQVWRHSISARELTKNLFKTGHLVVFSSNWNLSAFKYGPDWKDFYDHDPARICASAETRDAVIGGEATLWSHIVDATNLIPRVWPRASAMAERLWSSQSMTNKDDAAYRLDEQRCRMLNRGIRAMPILNGYCGDQDLDYTDNYPAVD